MIREILSMFHDNTGNPSGKGIEAHYARQAGQCGEETGEDGNQDREIVFIHNGYDRYDRLKTG